MPRKEVLPQLRVAPLAGSVDRNITLTYTEENLPVAPLAGSVDRNSAGGERERTKEVAPLAGSVDRNPLFGTPRDALACRSPRGERG